MNLRTVRALILKNIFVWRRSTFRLVDLFFFPLMDLAIWGMVTTYMLRLGRGVPSFIVFLLAAVVLWMVLQRAQQTVNLSFMEDIWAKNLLNMFAAPIRLSEYVAAAYLLGLLQAAAVLVILGVAAYVFYGFNVLVFGIGLGMFFINLLFMGWSVGLLISGIILRWGHSAEILVWAITMLIQPLSAVFYPVHILPAWIQPVALALPSTHVFEGMREVLMNGQIDFRHMWWAFGLNIIYSVLSVIAFNALLQSVRKQGLLAKNFA
jgi:ABC-2 type transport system permease protein